MGVNKMANGKNFSRERELLQLGRALRLAEQPDQFRKAIGGYTIGGYKIAEDGSCSCPAFGHNAQNAAFDAKGLPSEPYCHGSLLLAATSSRSRSRRAARCASRRRPTASSRWWRAA